MKKTLLLLLSGALSFLTAAEYFVAGSGNDKNPGTEKSPWRSIVGNPDMPAVPQMLQFKNCQDIAPGAMKMTDGYAKEAAELGKRYGKEELKYVRRVPQEWNFADWFARNPECIKLNIGLERELFTKGIPNGR